MLDLSPLAIWRRSAFSRVIDAERRMRQSATTTARVVCIASGKGGTGKSVVATNLAVLRAQRGERVLLIDFDAGLANAHLLLGLAPRHDFGHVLDGSVRAKDAIVEGPDGVHLISGGVGRHALANPTRRELEQLFEALRPLEFEYDLILVDHGAGLSYSTVAHLAATSTLLLVTNHEVTALSDAYALYKRAQMVNQHLRVGMVLNRCPDEKQAMLGWERFKKTSLQFLGTHPELVGWVPADEAVGRSVQLRKPVSLSEPASQAAQAIAKVAAWTAIETARTPSSFYERAKKALR
jgi:flagellar biosynthesis protein FlhG